MGSRALRRGLAVGVLSACFLSVAQAEVAPRESLRDAEALFHSGQYFKAARYAFQASEDPGLEAEANAWVTLGLARARLYQSASYFFIRTLQSGNRAAIRRVLSETQELFIQVGADLFRKYLIRHTQYEDYDALNRSAYLYALGKEALLSRNEEKAVGYLSSVASRSPLYPYALQLRATALAILGKSAQALEDFRGCARRAADARPAAVAEDLEARCWAGEARTLYQMDRFEEADEAYDRIPRESIVWPEILFEQSWNAFSQKEYNRALGRLVSYKSPALGFVFNPEVDVLRAQSYLALCLYGEANEVINEFNSRYATVGKEIKRLIESSSKDLSAFHVIGKEALKAPPSSPRGLHPLLNRFVRGPYFQSLSRSEDAIEREKNAIQFFNEAMPGVARGSSRGFPGFLSQVLGWRGRSIRMLGGAFVKNSLLDHYALLLSDFDKIAFIKLEMLKRAKDSLMRQNQTTIERGWGSAEPSRKDYQYYWGFNGEFWNDELGDYIFALESECGKDSAS